MGRDVFPLCCLWSRSVMLTLCDPVDCSLPGSSIHGIFQTRVLEWAAISHSRGPSPPRDKTRVSHTVGRCFTSWATREVCQIMVEVMRIMSPPSEGPRRALLHSAPYPAAGHHQPTPPMETPGHSQASLVSLLWGHCPFLLGPGAQGSVCAHQESVSQSCVSSGTSVVGLMVTSSKRAYAIPKSASRAPVPAAVHCWPVPP